MVRKIRLFNFVMLAAIAGVFAVNDFTAAQEGEGESDCVGEAINVWMTNRNARHPVELPGGVLRVGEILVPINVSSAEAISPAGMQIELRYDSEFLNPETVQVRPTAITGKMSFLLIQRTPDTLLLRRWALWAALA